MRIKPMLDNKEILGKDLARAIGISASYISTIWKTGVGPRSIDGFARVLKFRDADELRNAAYDWYREQGPKASVRLDEAAVQQAVAIQKANHPNISDDHWNVILARFDHPDFAGRSIEYWLLALGQEVTQDMLAERAAQDAVSEERRHAKYTEGKKKAAIQDGFKAAARVKKQKVARDAIVSKIEEAAAAKGLSNADSVAERRR